MTGARSLLQTILDEAVAATGASCGWLLCRADAAHVVAAATEGVASGVTIGQVVPLVGARGYTVASGQSSALMPRADDRSNAGVGGFAGVPPSLVVAEGGEGAVLLEVAAKRDGTGFTFDDIDLVSSMAQVAAAAVRESRPQPRDAPAPARLAGSLQTLAATDARRYGEVAPLIAALLGVEW